MSVWGFSKTAVEPAAYEREVRTNLLGVLNGAKVVLAGMRGRGGGTVINISSVSDRKTCPAAVAYTATKYAVRALTESLREAEGRSGVRVVNIAPGYVKTGIHRGMGVTFEQYCAALGDPDFMTADELAGIIYYCYQLPAHLCAACRRRSFYGPPRSRPGEAILAFLALPAENGRQVASAGFAVVRQILRGPNDLWESTMFRWFDGTLSRNICGQPTPRRRVFRPAVEPLENRLTPDGTVTGAFLNGTWTLTGDASANDIVINSTGVPGGFTISGNSTSVPAAPSGFVKKIVIDFGDGGDTVTLNNNATPIALRGLTINGGNALNTVTATDLTIRGNLAITNQEGGDNDFTNLKVAATATPGTGKVTIDNGNGGSTTRIHRTGTGFNSIARTLRITNGTGLDGTTIEDTNVGGSIINDNGSGGGAFIMTNGQNPLTRATIGGSLTVTYVDGGSETAIQDVLVKGNVTVNTGSGTSITRFDALITAAPVKIKGKLTITGTGTDDAVVIGAGTGKGLTVGKSMTITSTGTGAGATISLTEVQVGGGLTIDWTVSQGTLAFANVFVTGPTTVLAP